jgi:uncharacterized protein (TIGR03437 family)
MILARIALLVVLLCSALLPAKADPPFSDYAPLGFGLNGGTLNASGHAQALGTPAVGGHLMRGLLPQSAIAGIMGYRPGLNLTDALAVANAANSIATGSLGAQGALNSLAFLGVGSNGSNWNPFLGQQPYSGGFNANFAGYNQLHAGAGFSSDPVLQSLLGYNSSSSLNFGTQFLMNFSSLTNPWQNRGFAFGGLGLNAEWEEESRAGSLAQLEARYSALAQQQLAYYYTSASLSELRAESNRVVIYQICKDPLLMFYSFQVESFLDDLYASRPSYPRLRSLAQEIASWTLPPDSEYTLEQRYRKRLEYAALTQQLLYEAAQYFAATPQMAALFRDYFARINQIISQSADSAEIRQWSADWNTRWQNSFRSNSEYTRLEQSLNQILTDYPDFKDYLRLRNEVVAQLPGFSNYPELAEVGKKTTDVLNSPSASRAVNEHYSEYTDQVGALLNSTSFKAEIERYYERLNGLINSDSRYYALKTSEYLVIASLRDFQKRVRDEVYNCYAANGNACNPYTNPRVVALYNQNAVQLIRTAGSFYEIQNRFWHDFYNSSAYLNMESETLRRVQDTLQPVLSSLNSARSQFNERVNDLQEIRELRAAQSAFVAAARRNSPDLDQRLNRMEALAEQLRLGITCDVTPLSIGQKVTGRLSENSCRSLIKGRQYYARRFSFNGSSGQQITILLNGEFSERLHLMDSTGKLLTSGSRRIPSGEGFYSLPSTGNYIIEVTSFYDGDEGDFELNVSEAVTCSYSISPATKSFTKAGGRGVIEVKTQSLCGYQARSNADWIRISGGGTGDGDGSFFYDVKVNNTGKPRTGVITVGGREFTISQAGAGNDCVTVPIKFGQRVSGVLTESDCYSEDQRGYAIFSDLYLFTASAGQQVEIWLETYSSLNYTLSGPNGFVTSKYSTGFKPAFSGTLPYSGSYTIRIHPTFSSDAIPRDYTLLVQLAGNDCTFMLYPQSMSLSAKASEWLHTVRVVTKDECAWTAVSSVPWITIDPATRSGKGGGRVEFKLTANPAASPRTGTITAADQTFTVIQAGADVGAVTSVSAASYSAEGGLASEAIASAFGTGLATATQVASGLPLPTSLAGTTVKVKDSLGVERPAPLFFVSASQINYQVPPGTVAGVATVTVTSGNGFVSTGTLQVARTAPSLFSANSSGSGLAAAVVVRVHNDLLTYEPVAQFDAQNRLVPVPLDLGPETDQVFLILFGTGIRNHSSPASVSIGGVSARVDFAGAAPGYVGLDQVNVLVPRSLRGRGEVDVVLAVDGKTANTVTVSIR